MVPGGAAQFANASVASLSSAMVTRGVNKIYIGLSAAFLIFGAAEPLLADTACTIDPARSQMALALSADALAIRNKLFLNLCPEKPQPLVDISDPTLVGRFERPGNLTIPSPPDGPFSQPGSVLLTYVIEIDGSVQHVTVLKSSGFKELDVAAVEIWRHAKFAPPPGKLDGQPVRVLSYAKVPFTLK